jgi:erythromycin esterase
VGTMDKADAAALDWIGAHLVAVKSLDPASTDEDIEPLRQPLDGVRIVGLGESTHGVHEFFAVKQRLVEFLVRELGFTVFALEASHAACQPINDYVLHGTGDLQVVLHAQHYLAWDTEEFAGLVGWLREHNRRVAPDRAVTFHGLDAGYNEIGRASIRGYLARWAPERLDAIEPVLAALAGQELKWPLAIDQAVIQRAVAPLRDLERFLDVESERLTLQSSPSELAHQKRCVRVMSQWVEPGWPRERHLTDNLVHILEEQRPGAKAVLWLHNSHVAVEVPPDSEPRMGWRLRDRYGAAYWCLALEFGHGTFQTRQVTADGQMGDLVVTEMPAPPARSLPWYLERVGVPAFVLPLRAVEEPAVREWLRRPLLEHGGMWIHTDPTTLYEEVVVADQYDAILFVDAITAAQPTAAAFAAARDRRDF